MFTPFLGIPHCYGNPPGALDPGTIRFLGIEDDEREPVPVTFIPIEIPFQQAAGRFWIIHTISDKRQSEMKEHPAE